MKRSILLSTALAAALLADVAQAQLPSLIPPDQPPLVRALPPAPDPGLSRVGPCVWAAVGAAPLAQEAQPALSRYLPSSVDDYVPSFVGMTAQSASVLAAIRACDANRGLHWRYSNLVAATYIGREASLARLTVAGIDRAALDEALSTLSETDRQTYARIVEGHFTGTPPSGPVRLEFEAVFERLRLPPAPKVGSYPTLSPERGAVLDYLFARDLYALTLQRASEASPPPDAPARGWQVEHLADDADFYPNRARRTETSGTTAATCLVAEDGVLERCALLREIPLDYGFGDAFLRLLSTWRIRMGVQPSPAPGSAITFSLVWRAPGG